MKYDRVVRYVLSTPWAMRPEALGALLDVLAYRARGGRFVDEEIAERVADTVSRRDAARGRAASRGSVAVLPLYGSIFPRANLFTEFSGGTSLDQWGSTFRRLDADPKVSHIVLDVASPGGSVELVPETADLVRNASTPTTAVANAEAASAAYWIAAQADELVVTPSGAVGSIGVWAAHEDWSRHVRNMGVETTLISAGRYKTEGNPWEPLSSEARDAIQADVDEFYRMFTEAVAVGRGVSQQVAAGERFGEGRMVLAADAVRRGMADRVATLADVVNELASGAGKPQVVADDPTPTVEASPSAEAKAEPAPVMVPGAERLLRRRAVREGALSVFDR